MKTLRDIRRLLRSALASSLVAWGTAVSAQTSVMPSGEGTAESPYQITQLGNLVWMGETVTESAGKHYRMMNDIDASETAGWNDGQGFTPIGRDSGGYSFCGLFDGGGHVVRGLSVGCENGYAGLFGCIGEGGHVQNLALVGAYLDGYFAGGIVGWNLGGIIENCYVSACLKGVMAGGIVGVNNYGRVERCYADGVFESYGAGPGGIACDSWGLGTISECYAAARLLGEAKGGLLSYGGGGSSSCVTNAYWDVETSGAAVSLGGEGKTAAEMRQAATFAGWDFTNVWGIAEGASTPYLRIFPPPFTLNVVTQGMGRIAAEPCKTTYAAGERVTLTAYSDAPGYVFKGWDGGESNALTTVTTVTMTGHRTVQATFVPAIDISTVEELQGIDDSSNYRLTQDIDASATTNWNAGAGFAPLGDTYRFDGNGYVIRGFTGIFDGNGHVIRGLTINRAEGFGLFKEIRNGAIVRRVGIVGGTMKGEMGGGLVGLVDESRIEQCYSTCDVLGHGYGSVGGLVGDNGGLIIESYATGTITLEGNIGGGLVGANGPYFWNRFNGRIVKCFAMGDIVGNRSYGEGAGGLIGVNAGDVSECFATGNLSGGLYDSGGLVGANYTAVHRCFATGTVKGIQAAGGLFAHTEMADIGECHSVGKVIGEEGWDSGGGWHGHGMYWPVVIYWNFEASWPGWLGYETGFLTAAQMKQRVNYEGWNFDSVWGIAEGQSYPYLRAVGRPFMLNAKVVGAGKVTIRPDKASYTPGERVTLTATPENTQHLFIKWTGGVADEGSSVTTVTMDTHRTVTAYFSDGVTEIDSLDELQRIGNDAAYSVTGCYRLTQDIDASATADWNEGAGFLPIGSASDFVGVFDGNGHAIYNLSVIRTDYDAGMFSRVGAEGIVRNLRLIDVTVGSGQYVGGLVGFNRGLIDRCEVSGVVTGSVHVGTIVGVNKCGTVERCYATGQVWGGMYVGGVVGFNAYGFVSHCYAASVLAGEGASCGGISSSMSFGSMTNAYWDVEVSGCATSAGGLGKNTEEMRRQATFEGWDFATEWGLDEGTGYPFLWQFRMALPPGLGVSDTTNQPGYAAWAAAHTNAWGSADFSGVPALDFETAWLVDTRPVAGVAAGTDFEVRSFDVGEREIRVGLALTAAGAAKQGQVNGWVTVQGKAALADAWVAAAGQPPGDARIAFTDGLATLTIARPEGFRFFRPVIQAARVASAQSLMQVEP